MDNTRFQAFEDACRWQAMRERAGYPEWMPAPIVPADVAAWLRPGMTRAEVAKAYEPVEVDGGRHYRGPRTLDVYPSMPHEGMGWVAQNGHPFGWGGRVAWYPYGPSAPSVWLLADLNNDGHVVRVVWAPPRWRPRFDGHGHGVRFGEAVPWPVLGAPLPAKGHAATPARPA
jgi:hypothetical protein